MSQISATFSENVAKQKNMLQRTNSRDKILLRTTSCPATMTRWSRTFVQNGTTSPASTSRSCSRARTTIGNFKSKISALVPSIANRKVRDVSYLQKFKRAAQVMLIARRISEPSWITRGSVNHIHDFHMLLSHLHEVKDNRMQDISIPWRCSPRKRLEGTLEDHLPNVSAIWYSFA